MASRRTSNPVSRVLIDGKPINVLAGGASPYAKSSRVWQVLLPHDRNDASTKEG